jgi:hypothetical protein
MHKRSQRLFYISKALIGNSFVNRHCKMHENNCCAFPFLPRSLVFLLFFRIVVLVVVVVVVVVVAAASASASASAASATAASATAVAAYLVTITIMTITIINYY